MRQNRYDKILDRILSRIDRVSDKMAREFKNTNPFDMVKVSDEDRIATYMSLPPEISQDFYNTSPEGWSAYNTTMQQLIRRHQND